MDALYDFADNSLPHHFYIARHILGADLAYSRQERINHEMDSADQLMTRLPGQVLVSHRTSAVIEALLGFEDYMYTVNIYDDSVWLTTHGASPEAAEDALAWLSGHIPPVAAPDEGHIKVNFWMQGADGNASCRTTKLTAPHWADIARNYPAATQGALADLMELNSPEEGGKLVLLHGKPGGGKSYAIRALSKAWAPWCNTHYLIDPDRFFTQVQYMYQILLNDGGGDKYKLIVCEDSDEFIRSDAKDRTGQGLARLLNLADGIMGQGMKLIILLTTNEPLSALHPAVIRPGRCLANVEFRSFNQVEATAWLGHPPTKSRPEHSLAELFDCTQIMPERQLVPTGGMYI